MTQLLCQKGMTVSTSIINYDDARWSIVTHVTGFPPCVNAFFLDRVVLIYLRR